MRKTKQIIAKIGATKFKGGRQINEAQLIQRCCRRIMPGSELDSKVQRKGKVIRKVPYPSIRKLLIVIHSRLNPNIIFKSHFPSHY